MQALAEIGQSPEAVAQIAVAISHQIGRPVSVDDLVNQFNDSGSAELFSVKVPDLIQSFATASAMSEVYVGDAGETLYQLPQKVAWHDAPDHFVNVDGGPQQLHGNLYQYAIPSTISTSEFKIIARWEKSWIDWQ